VITNKTLLQTREISGSENCSQLSTTILKLSVFRLFSQLSMFTTTGPLKHCIVAVVAFYRLQEGVVSLIKQCQALSCFICLLIFTVVFLFQHGFIQRQVGIVAMCRSRSTKLL